MLKTNKSISITGQSYIEVSDNGGQPEKIIAYMDASISENGDININKSIQDKELFNKTKKMY